MVDSYCEDADQNSIWNDGAWDIRDAPNQLVDGEGATPPDLAVTVGTVDITHARGVPMKFILEKDYGGVVTGLAFSGSKRARRASRGVRIYSRDTHEEEPEWALLGNVGTDIHGRFRGPMSIEDGGGGDGDNPDHTHDRSREYRVALTDELGAAVNRSYWVQSATARGSGGVSLYTDPTGVEWCAWIEGSDVKLARKDNAPHTWGTPVTVDSTGAYDAVHVTGDGQKISVACHSASNDKAYEFLCDHNTGAKKSGPHLIGT